MLTEFFRGPLLVLVAAALCTGSLTGVAAALDGTCYINAAGKPECRAANPGSTPTRQAPASPPAAGGSGTNGEGSTDNGASAGGGPAGGGGSTGGGGQGDNANLPPGECAWRAMVPQPPAGDPLWEGNDPATGVVQFTNCNGPTTYQFAASGAPAPAGPPLPPPPDPADLAEQARAQLNLPDPTLGRSPALDDGDPARGGQPYTLVNLWTRFYTDPATFTTVSKTVAVQGVSATATAVPRALVFEPGDGRPPVSCPGPGRPWTSADGFDAPGPGECGYQYLDVHDEPVTATVSIAWDVTWTGTGGTGGAFDGITTSASSQFLVQQIQIVVK